MESPKNRVKLSFDGISKSYDEQRRKLIPCFDDFYSIAASLASSDTAAPAVLDLGAGTGLFSAYVAERYPDARFTLTDLSESMLDIARNRFEGRANFRYITADYTMHDYGDEFDLVISSLSIHHLDEVEKQSLYARVCTMLKPGGIFINADQVLGSTPELESLYQSVWRASVESSGLSREAIEAAYARTRLDQMSTLDDQLEWLRSSGFTDVDCMYKYYNFVVMAARKPLDAGTR